MQSMPPETLAALRTSAAGKVKCSRLELYEPYAKQRLFHVLGVSTRERALIAANQSGKTFCAGAEVAMHMTGRYPGWWEGKRFDHAVRWTAGSESAELTRKGIQRVLLGPPETEAEWGTGMLPKDTILFADIARAQGTPDAVATIPVRHVSGDVSVLQMASYSQGRGKWQADTLDGVWFDEEPPLEIYTEGMTRTNISEGPVLLTATPMLGMTTVLFRLMRERPAGTAVVSMTLDDAEHYTPEQRLRLVATYPEHEREARTKGIPMRGSGLIFQVPESDIVCAPFEIPEHWPRICGLDFGADHPTAAAWLAWDRDADVIYVYDAYRKSGNSQMLPLHAAAIKARGDWILCAWPHDGNNETAAGPQLAKQYRDQGVNMREENAKFPEDPKAPERSRISVEAGVSEMLTRMITGRFKVFRHLGDWLEEYRQYHRDKGVIVKVYDDLISATRIAIMDLRYATTNERHERVRRERNWRVA